MTNSVELLLNLASLFTLAFFGGLGHGKINRACVTELHGCLSV